MAKKNSSAQPSGALDVSAKTADAPPIVDTEPQPTSFVSTLTAYFQRQLVWIPIALAFFASLVTLKNELTAEDYLTITGNTLLKSLANLPAAFTANAWRYAPFDVSSISQAYYRPLFNSWLILGNAIFGTSAWGWHLMAVLLHAGAAALVFAVVRELFYNRRLALIAACLFAVLPVHAEAVAWASGGVEVFMSVMLLAAFYFYLRYRNTGKVYQLGLGLVFYLLALWSKEAAVAFPLVIACLGLVRVGQTATTRSRRGGQLLFWLGMGLVTAVYVLMRYMANGAVFAFAEARFPFRPALLTMPWAIIKYLLLLIWPFNYSYIHYTKPVESVFSAWFLVPLVVVLALAAVVALRGSRELKFAALWFFLTLLPSLVVMNRFEIEHLIQERYLYLPSLALCLAVAFGIEWLAARQTNHPQPDRMLLAAVAVLVVVYGALYIFNSLQWHDSPTLYRHAVAVAPNSAAAHAALASELFTAGRPRDAEAEAQRAIDLDPQYDNGYLISSYLMQQRGSTSKAVALLEQAKNSIPQTPVYRSDLATVLLNLSGFYSQKKGDAADSIATDYAQQSVSLWPRATGWYNTALLYANTKRYNEALQFYQEAQRRLPPTYPQIHLALGIVYEGLEWLEDARREYQTYLQLAAPDAPEIKGTQQLLKKVNDRLNVPNPVKSR